jgi:hypothetical protein
VASSIVLAASVVSLDSLAHGINEVPAWLYQRSCLELGERTPGPLLELRIDPIRQLRCFEKTT